MSVAAPEALIAALADRYRIERELGRGGMATVYLAEDRKHHRQVALKVLRPELAQVVGAERFLQEIEVMAGLQHPHILPLFDSGTAGTFLYYVMPFVDGESLRERLGNDGRLPLEAALAIAGDVAAALTMAHQRGIIHRDIKPENIMLSGGEALVADFGVALALSKVSQNRLTEVGLAVGTPSYMSPEQVAGERQVDGRSDVYALAAVLFEMLTGEPPFTGPSAQAVFAQVMATPARGVRALRPEVPASIEAAIARGLAKDPAARFQSPLELIAACALPGPGRVPRRWLVLGGVTALLLVAAIGWPLWQEGQRAHARALLPTIASLADEGRYPEAYALAREAERRIAGDSLLARLLIRVSDLLTVTSEPAGATVYLQPLPAEGATAGDSVRAGTTPITELRVPRTDHRLIAVKEGYAPLERIASSGIGRGRIRDEVGRRVGVALRLWPADSVPSGMVAVPGGPYRIVSPDLPLHLEAELAPYFLDRFEVSNAAYREFVRGGGYGTDAYRRLTEGRVPAGGLVDRTGLPGPRDWVSQEPPAGQERHPVTGVSWYEASAFCAARGARLPTLFEWEKAARDGQASPTGVIMPWGYTSAAVSAERRANFGGSGTVPVDAHPFGISPYGAYAMAGNVKEWLANPVGEGYAVAGGSWQDPAYLFSEAGTVPPANATAAIGFRCARRAEAGPGDQGAGPLRLQVPPPAYRPVDPATFRTLLGFYRYDPKPARPRGLEVTETSDWRRERVWIDGVGGDSILAYLYLPKHAAPPYQTIVYVPSSAAFFFGRVWQLAEGDLAPHIQAGRAVLAVVLKGMVERPWPAGTTQPAPSSVEFRDNMVRHATELRMALDYLVGRPDIDGERLAYYGLSLGAGSRLPLAAVDDRFRSVVLVGGGIDERMQPTLPEAANFNFAPYITPPKLMLNGRQDEEHPWNTRGLPLWTLLREPKELVLVDGAGHHPPAEQRVPAINAFLDRTLGVVKAGAARP